MKLMLFYLVIMNAIGFFMMYHDKEKAKKGDYRTPEARLWQIAIAGGAIGETIAMKRFRHKTQHTNFKYGLPAISILYVVAVIFLLIAK